MNVDGTRPISLVWGVAFFKSHMQGIGDWGFIEKMGTC